MGQLVGPDAAAYGGQPRNAADRSELGALGWWRATMPLKPNPESQCLYHPYVFTGDIARARRVAHWAIN